MIFRLWGKNFNDFFFIKKYQYHLKAKLDSRNIFHVLSERDIFNQGYEKVLNAFNYFLSNNVKYEREKSSFQNYFRLN